MTERDKEDVEDEVKRDDHVLDPLLSVLPSAINGNDLSQSTGADSCPRIGQVGPERSPVGILSGGEARENGGTKR